LLCDECAPVYHERSANDEQFHVRKLVAANIAGAIRPVRAR
jgi:hypothetical protein